MRQIWKTVVLATLAALMVASGTGVTTYIHTCHMMARTDVTLSPKKCCGEAREDVSGAQFHAQCCEHDTHVYRTVQYSPVELKFDFQPVLAVLNPLPSLKLPENTIGFFPVDGFPRPPDPGGRSLLNLFQTYRI